MDSKGSFIHTVTFKYQQDTRIEKLPLTIIQKPHEDKTYMPS